MNVPDIATIRRALELATRAPSIHNSQPWRWRWHEPVLDLFADGDRWLTHTDPRQTDLTVSCGAAVHHARAALASLGFSVKVERSPNPARPDHLATLRFTGAPPEPRLAAWASAIDTRRSDRSSYTSWEVPPGIIDLLRQIGSDHGVIAVPLHSARAHRQLVDAMAAAETIRTPDPAYRAETAAWTGRAPTDRLGAPSAELGIEPYLLNRLPFTDAPTSDDGGAPIHVGEDDASALIAIGTWRDDIPSRLRAGEALSAILLEATAIGLATCPLSLPIEVPTIRENLRTDLFLGRAHPQIIVRVGWAHLHQTPPPRTPRLPLDEVFDTE